MAESLVVIGAGEHADVMLSAARTGGWAVASALVPVADALRRDVGAPGALAVIASPELDVATLVEVIWGLVQHGRSVWVDHPALAEFRALLPAMTIGARSGTVLRPLRQTSRLQRAVDAGVAVAALLVLSPVLLVAAAVIKATSPGPVLHRAVVVGQDRRRFTWYKLRTMRLATQDRGEDERRRQFAEFVAGGEGATTKIVDEARITPIGRFLRRHSLDELPQLASLLKGDMTLIGPRPCLEYEFELLKPWHRRRFAVRPGLTGLWQVRGRGAVHADTMAFMDICYALGRTWRSDARIVWETVKVVCNGRGAR